MDFVFDVNGSKVFVGHSVLVTQGEYEGSSGIFKGFLFDGVISNESITVEVDNAKVQFPLEINGSCFYIQLQSSVPNYIKTVRFNESHMRELEDMANLTWEQRNSLDCIPSTLPNLPEDFGDILSTFNWAMYEGSADLISSKHEKAYLRETLDFVGHYCTTRNIAHDILLNGNMYVLHLH